MISWPPLTLLPGWQERLDRLQAGVAPERRLVARRAALPLLEPRMDVLDAAAAAAMVARLSTTPLAVIAVDSEYRYATPPVALRSGKDWHDPLAMEPLIVSITAWFTGATGDAMATFVLDVRVPDVARALCDVLHLPLTVVAHHAKAELFTFWQLGLDPDVEGLFDTFIAAAALGLGERDGRMKPPPVTLGEEISQQQAEEKSRAHALSLLGQCARYGIDHPFARDKERFRESFLAHPAGAPFTDDQLAYAAADAEATMRLYVAMAPEIERAGLRGYLERVEMPFVVANARVERAGVPLDRRGARRVRIACGRMADRAAIDLAEHGVDNPNSRSQIIEVLSAAGLRREMVRGSQVRLDRDVLKAIKSRHPVPGLVLRYREYGRLAAEEWLAGLLTCADGRLRPAHHQLRAATGRNACATPNLLGIPTDLRPLVKASVGRVLVELDFGQVEVAVAAGEYRDAGMAAAYASADLYASMAQQFYQAQLTDDERAMDVAAFKVARPDLRKTMKVFVLAVLYNMSPNTIASRYGTSIAEATAQRQRFLDTFPSARDGLAASATYGLARGYAYIRGGPRRTVAWSPGMRWKATNALINTPIQGAAAVAFKSAVIAIDRHLRGSGAMIVMLAHDAVVIECDEGEADQVVHDAAFMMKAALRTMYPTISPKVDVVGPSRHWCKDGDQSSVARFLADAGLIERDVSLTEWLDGSAG